MNTLNYNTKIKEYQIKYNNRSIISKNIKNKHVCYSTRKGNRKSAKKEATKVEACCQLLLLS